MHWLTHSEAESLAKTISTHHAPQMLSLFAEAETLASEIPTRPILIPAEQGPPSPMHQWYGRVGNRLITVESEAKEMPHRSVVIRTGFLQNQNMSGDWVVLLELQELPNSINARRPLFIESRTINPKCVVYRPDPRGWKTAIYAAGSVVDAENLLAFMKEDEWNEPCFIGDPPPPGKWTTVQGESVILGTGSGLNEALRFACEWSLRYDPVELLVKDVSGTSKDVFVVCRGRVSQPS